MKKALLIFAFVLVAAWCGFGQENNDFYDNTPAKTMAGSLKIELAGEIANPGPVDLQSLPRHSLIVREACTRAGKTEFIGSYRYDGYSLFDILKEKFLAKKNKAEFGSVIDLLVVVDGRGGERVVLSWGEIYYPTAMHRIIIADRVAPIIPTLTKEQWPLPEKVKLVCGNDLVSERNIDDPVRITVLSAPLGFKTVKGLDPLLSPAIKLFSSGMAKGSIAPPLPEGGKRSYPSVFYGRGKGFHGVTFFSGNPLADILKAAFPMNSDSLKRGYLVIAGLDGYRIVVSCSELFNRNDQADFLLVQVPDGENGGRFKVFPTPDFFSDRAVKAVASIHYLQI